MCGEKGKVEADQGQKAGMSLANQHRRWHFPYCGTASVGLCELPIGMTNTSLCNSIVD